MAITLTQIKACWVFIDMQGKKVFPSFHPKNRIPVELGKS